MTSLTNECIALLCIIQVLLVMYINLFCLLSKKIIFLLDSGAQIALYRQRCTDTLYRYNRTDSTAHIVPYWLCCTDCIYISSFTIRRIFVRKLVRFWNFIRFRPMYGCRSLYRCRHSLCTAVYICTMIYICTKIYICTMLYNIKFKNH